MRRVGSWLFGAGIAVGVVIGPAVAASAEPGVGVPKADAVRAAQRRRRGQRPPAAGPDAAPPAGGAAPDAAAAEAPAGPVSVREAMAQAPTEEDSTGAGSLRRSSHMEFDARLVRGERAGTGAVILFDRGLRELPPLTSRRTRFLDATVEAVMGAPGASTAPPPAAAPPATAPPADGTAHGAPAGRGAATTR